MLAGVGSSSKETVLPANERKIVFGGVESLYFFHRDSFLPSLEVAAAPLMKSAEELKHVDADGHLSLTVSKAVGNMFVKHAAFMKMYRTYIKYVVVCFSHALYSYRRPVAILTTLLLASSIGHQIEARNRLQP